ncbi:unnamed protein product [Cyberlindnera jadinii]|uniref:DNA repair protein RAD50 n=1 Tax=Cyberlindnera jadinii (strain ATCC 18201 / CBS 1600 / BCRC 20928 / JCM 3617 / NBRC 0987 / NRRL Y-1542) TaxID=983966 RepID=A0A0H5CF68_CYBJN|nr:unnamed protein product [Cyberlindnera jadinii]
MLTDHIVKTIIECLRYATTGAFPPNSKGGAFVHDPGMYGEKEVKAEVKLAFQSVSGNSMVCTRAMQVIAKKTGLTFKSLEGQLLQLNRGERTTISTKCAELEALVPANLGTPRPILDYVIFCHQEDSLWPLSEPANLKKKFDEIFEALKFTKALDNLKSIKKDMIVDIKLLDQSVKHLKQDKERADRTVSRLEKKKSTVDIYENETSKLESDIAEVQRESDVLFKSNQEFQETISKLDSLRHDQRSIEAQLERLHGSCELLPDSNDDIKYKLANFQRMLDKSSKELDVHKHQSKSIQKELTVLRQQQNSFIGSEGELRAKETKLKEDMDLRRGLVSEIFGPQAEELSESRFAEWQRTLQLSLEEKKKALEQYEKTSSDELAVVESRLAKIKGSQVKEAEHKQYSVTDRNNLQMEIKSIQSTINELNSNEGDLEYEKSSLEDLIVKLKTFTDNKYLEKAVQNIKLKNQEINTMEADIEEISRNISNAHKQSDSHAKISIITDGLKFKQKALEKLLNANKEPFAAHNIDISSPQESFNRKMQKLKMSHIEEDRNLKALHEEVHNLKNMIKYKNDSLNDIEGLIASSEAHFKAELDDGEAVDKYDEVVMNAEADYKLTLENLKMGTTTLEFNKKALEVAESSSCCYLCSRKFKDNNLLGEFIEDLKRKTRDEFEAKLREQFEDAKQYLEAVRSVATDVEKINTGKKSLAEIKAQLDSANEKLHHLEDSYNQQKITTDQLGASISSMEALRNPVNEITRLKSDIETAEQELDMKVKALGNYGTPLQSLDDLQKSHHELTSKIRSLRREVAFMQEEKESKQREFSVLEGTIKDKRLVISNLERSLVERKNLVRSVQDLEKKMDYLSQSIVKSDNLLIQLKEEASIVQDELDSLRSKHREVINELNLEHEKSLGYYNKLEHLNKSAYEYVNHVQVELEAIRESVREVETNIADKELQLGNLTQLISNEELRLADTNSEERNLRENLEIRQLEEKLVYISGEIRELELQNAEAEREKYQQRSNKLRQRYTDLTAELAGKKGEIRQINDQIEQLQRELNTEFKDVEKNYRQEWTKLQTRTVVSADLDTYAKALDSAIMSFHSLKMKEINRIIDELWKSTYSGTDVDTIKIKSDPSTGKANRSYNYRVVMYKQDAELDMRGRCSAGQKVLACIIIRLALSECFGTNCGVIALDEPTTNLDSDNIESLAHSLGRIIEMRRSQKNFQLIVITHDEKFLHSMGAGKYADHFFQLKRDESQNSRIELVDISKVSV